MNYDLHAGWQFSCGSADKGLVASHQQALFQNDGDTSANGVVGDPCDPDGVCHIRCRVGMPHCCNGRCECSCLGAFPCPEY